MCLIDSSSVVAVVVVVAVGPGNYSCLSYCVGKSLHFALLLLYTTIFLSSFYFIVLKVFQ